MYKKLKTSLSTYRRNQSILAFRMQIFVNKTDVQLSCYADQYFLHVYVASLVTWPAKNCDKEVQEEKGNKLVNAN